jgi:hypothetical protein
MFDMKHRSSSRCSRRGRAGFVTNPHENHHVCARRSIDPAIIRAMPKVAREVRNLS